MKNFKDIIEAAKMKGGDPCWKGYQMVGMKDKGGKKVPNCVPEEVQTEGAVPANEKIITVKHKESGKTLRISAGAAEKYRSMGYHYHPVNEAKDEEEYGYEGDMAMNQLETVIRHATYLKDMMKPDTDLPEWVQSKITLATDYLQTACDYMTSEMKEEVELEEDISKMPTDKLQKHWDSHKDEQRPSPAFASKLKMVAKELAKRKAMKESSELNEDDNLGAIAKKHGMSFHRGTYGANMTHPTKGYVNVNRYGEWSHHPVGKGTTGHGPSKAHGDSSQNFSGLDKHLSSLKEEVEQIDEISDKLAGDYLKKVNTNLIKKVGMKPDLYNHLEPKRQKGATRALNRLMKPVEEDNKPEQDTPAKASLMKRSEKPTAYVHEGAMKRMATDKEEDKRTGSWKVEGKWKTSPGTVTDKSGAKHTPMSRARDLARAAAKRNMGEQSNVKPNPFTVPSQNPGHADKPVSDYVKARNAGSSTKNARARAAGADNPHMFESRQADIIREAMKAGKEKKKQKEQSTGTADKFIEDPELSSKITKS